MILIGLVATAGLAFAGPPQWPAPPDPARLIWLDEVRGPERVVRRGGVWKRLLSLFLGLTPGRRQEGYRLAQPTGVWVEGRILLVADPGQRRVLRYDLDKRSGEWWPRGGAQSFESPVGVVGLSDGGAFVLDSALRSVYRLDPQGRVTGKLEGDPQGLGQPAGLTRGRGRVYVSDVRNHRVAIYGVDGVFIASFGHRGSGAGEFNFPTYLAFDERRSELWVCDSGNFRVQWFDSDGHPLGATGEPGNRPGFLARPRGIAVDSDGQAYVADAAFDAFQILDRAGRLLLFVGEAGPSAGEFNLPAGAFMDAEDRLYLADTMNGRVQIFRYLKEERP